MQSDFDFQPTLVGPRITVRPIAETDWNAMSAAAADPEIWEQHPAPDRYQKSVFQEYFDGALASGSAFAFVDQKTGNIIGSSRYHEYDRVAREIEIGWTFLTRDYWGGSSNLEIKQLMLDHAFKYLDTVVFWVGESNYRSRRAMEKIGGVLRSENQFRGSRVGKPDVIYEIRKELWRAVIR